jgi:uncharacterized membrane protein YqaE (UPF0057 family)
MKLKLHVSLLLGVTVLLSSCSVEQMMFSTKKADQNSTSKVENTSKKRVSTTQELDEDMAAAQKAEMDKENVFTAEELETSVSPTSLSADNSDLASSDNGIESMRLADSKKPYITENLKEESVPTVKPMKDRKVQTISKKSIKGMSDDTILYVILAILIPFLAVGLVTNWDITKVLICVLLCFLFWIPGVIYALYVVLS